MAVGAIVEDGKIQETASESSVKKAASKNGMDKDAFLQLLVAQMKYQDPLEPTSNTEYISQYATFSQVEQMQNMSSSMELSRASSMVGQLVNVETTDTNGETKEIQGVVEYVTYENNKAFVSIDGTIYSADDVKAVVDPTYQTAYDLAVAFATAMNQLPSLNELSLGDKETIDGLSTGFNNMTPYQQSFIANAYIKKLEEYVAQMEALVEAAKPDEEPSTDETDKTTDETDKTTDETAGKTDETTESTDETTGT